jgi:hypothetical protein
MARARVALTAQDLFLTVPPNYSADFGHPWSIAMNSQPAQDAPRHKQHFRWQIALLIALLVLDVLILLSDHAHELRDLTGYFTDALWSVDPFRLLKSLNQAHAFPWQWCMFYSDTSHAPAAGFCNYFLHPGNCPSPAFPVYSERVQCEMESARYGLFTSVFWSPFTLLGLVLFAVAFAVIGLAWMLIDDSSRPPAFVGFWCVVFGTTALVFVLRLLLLGLTLTLGAALGFLAWINGIVMGAVAGWLHLRHLRHDFETVKDAMHQRHAVQEGTRDISKDAL